MNFLPNTYEGIGWLVVGLAALCVAINQIDDFFERRKPKAGFPPAEQLDSSQRALESRVDKLEEAMVEIRREMRSLPNEIVALLKNTNVI